MVKQKTETILRQEKIIKILDNLEDWKLELISQDNPDMSELSKKDHVILLECCWIIIGKKDGEDASKKLIKKGIREIIVLCTLENFRRKGLMFINKKGNYDKTDLGREIDKELRKQEKLNKKEKAKTCATKHVIPPKSKDSGILPKFT